MEAVRKTFNLLNLLFSLSAIGTLIWFHGFQYNPHFLQPHLVYLNVCFGFFLVQFVFRAKLSGNPRHYLHKNKLEFFLFVFMVLELVMNWLMDFSIIQFLLSYSGVENHNHLFMLSLHVWILLIVGIELGKASTRSTVWKLSPAVLFILSFIVLIVIGSSLLMLPEMTADKQGMSFIDALFTSISANCVTGLIVVDTATYFSLKGKILIMLLIQLGGLNVIAFATYSISLFRKSFEKHHHATIKELMRVDNLDSIKNMVKKVVFTTLIIEFIGAIVLYQQWEIAIPNERERLFYSVFHAISAFNNAGFTLFTDGFTHAAVGNLFSIHITIAVLIVLGGLGFTTLQDTFRPGNILKLIRGKRISIHLQSKIALYSSVILILLGALCFYFFEYNNTLDHQNISERTVSSFFQSITARTAGFNTVNFGEVTFGMLIITLFLMFIGASSGSTGGGIKTSTLAVLLIAIFKRKERKSNYGNTFLTQALVKKALAILLYSLLVIIVGMIIMILVEPEIGITELLFEEISAFATVGLSTGITPELSAAGKAVIMITMFIGRIGPLALAYTLIKKSAIVEEKEEHGIMIG